jgi:hypothetical protein
MKTRITSSGYTIYRILAARFSFLLTVQPTAGRWFRRTTIRGAGTNSHAGFAGHAVPD